MEGPPQGVATPTLRLTRDAESSRLQLELVRRAFELIVPASEPTSNQPSARRSPRLAAPAPGVRLAGA
jgi:hypothetical protein